MNMYRRNERYRVGELRPSQTLYTYGIGSIVDLPHISALVMGLDDWETSYASEVGEPRLLKAVSTVLGPQIQTLLTPPVPPDQSDPYTSPFDKSAQAGILVAPFPRWMLCPHCRRLAMLESGLFVLKADHYRPDRIRYVHDNCKHANKPTVLPARFLVACSNGHLDDFPGSHFVHRGDTSCPARLTLREPGVWGKVAEIEVACEICQVTRRMFEALSDEGLHGLPPCSGRRPHLSDYDSEQCERPNRMISLGASNSWFPVILSTLAAPTANDRLLQLVEEYWQILSKTSSQQNIEPLHQIGQFPRLASYSASEIWSQVAARLKSERAAATEHVGLKVPEWHSLSQPATSGTTHDFKTTSVAVPSGYESSLQQVVLVERLRIVQSLIGFTRLEAPNEAIAGYTPADEQIHSTPPTRRPTTRVPAVEVRGKGLFLQFREETIDAWLSTAASTELDGRFAIAHRRWREARRIPHPEQGYPGLCYVFLHSFAHALIRRLTLACGYTASSIRERIYSLSPLADDSPMAGILLYTSVHDSEGTLGGLVSLEPPERFGG